jgi:hypothetical protein
VLHEGKYLVADVLADDATFRPESFEGMEDPARAAVAGPGRGVSTRTLRADKRQRQSSASG